MTESLLAMGFVLILATAYILVAAIIATNNKKK